jgi:hypothetical protein
MDIKFSKMMNGFHWVYTSGKHKLSIVLHDGSYGHEAGLFETMCSWLPDVQGHLTFRQVQTKIEHIYYLERKEVKGVN